MSDKAKSKAELIQEVYALRQQVCRQATELKALKAGDGRAQPGEQMMLTAPLQSQIDECQCTKKALEMANQRLRFHIENSPLIVVEWDSRFRVSYWSDEAEALFGWGREAVLGKHPNEWRFIFDEDVTAINNVTNRLLDGIDRRNVGLNRNYRQDGSVVHCEWYNSAFYDQDDTLVSILSLVLDVTERRRAELALQESEDRYRRLVELTFEALIIISQSRFVYVNLPGAKLFGAVSPQELIGQRVDEFVHSNSLRTFAAYIRWAKVNDGEVPLREERIIRPDGTYVEVEAASVFITYQGRTAIQIALRDITARKQAQAEQERLLVAERKQRLLAETLGEVFLALTAQTSREAVLDEIFRQMRRLISYSTANIALLEDDVLRMVRWQGYHIFSHIDDMAYLEQRLSEFPLDAEAVQLRQPVIVAETRAEPRWVELNTTHWIRSYVAVPICAGDRVLGILRLNSDIPNAFFASDIEHLQPFANAAAIALENARLHDQAREEIEERIQVEQELRQSEARNRALLDAIPDLIFRATGEGQYLDCQEGQEWGLAVPAQADIGKNIREVVPPDIADLTLDHIGKTLDSGTTQIFEYQLPLPHEMVDYETRMVVSGPNEILGIVRNITERKRAERRAIQTERLAALGQLAAALAHEMNNPLQATQSHLDLVLDFPLKWAEKERSLQIIRQEIERLSDVTRRILNYARPQSAQCRLVSVAELVEQVLMLARKRLQQSKIQTIVDLQDVPPVIAAPGQLTQVFLNLVINAAEAMPDGGLLQIELCLSYEQIVVSFTNNGPSISPDALPHIFEPFYTTKPEGNGLGLWVSHSLIQQHAGSLTVKNLDNDQGVVFVVQLPLAFEPELEVA